MGLYAIKPVFRTAETRYDAPTMIVEAHSHDAAIEIAKNSALGRFSPEWTFAVNPFQQKVKGKSYYPNQKPVNSKSKSQLGKKVTGYSESRPLRRALSRLAMKKNNQTGSHHKGGSMKMW